MCLLFSGIQCYYTMPNAMQWLEGPDLHGIQACKWYHLMYSLKCVDVGYLKGDFAGFITSMPWRENWPSSTNFYLLICTEHKIFKLFNSDIEGSALAIEGRIEKMSAQRKV